MDTPDLSVEDALRAYARMLNTQSADVLQPLLADDFEYESRAVFTPLNGKDAFLHYIRGKLESIRGTGAKVFAELGTVSTYGGSQPCVILAQPSKDRLVALVLAKVSEGKLRRLDLCLVPPPTSAVRSGEYPQ